MFTVQYSYYFPSRLLASIKTINNIDDERFTILFHKVLQGFCRTESTETCLFAPDEKDYLKKTLSLEDSTLDGMLSTLELIVKEVGLFFLLKMNHNRILLPYHQYYILT